MRTAGAAAGAFTWVQRIEAGDVADGDPAADRHFCDNVCLGQYVADAYPGYDPPLGPVGVRYGKE